jgi:hypothetical protein
MIIRVLCHPLPLLMSSASCLTHSLYSSNSLWMAKRRGMRGSYGTPECCTHDPLKEVTLKGEEAGAHPAGIAISACSLSCLLFALWGWRHLPLNSSCFMRGKRWIHFSKFVILEVGLSSQTLSISCWHINEAREKLVSQYFLAEDPVADTGPKLGLIKCRARTLNAEAFLKEAFNCLSLRTVKHLHLAHYLWDHLVTL